MSSTPVNARRDWDRIHSTQRRLERLGFDNVSTTPIGETVTAIDFDISNPVWATQRQQASSFIINDTGFGVFTLRFPLIKTDIIPGVELERIAETAVQESGLPDLPIIELMPHENNMTALHISYEQGANELLTVDEALDYISSIHEHVITRVQHEQQNL